MSNELHRFVVTGDSGHDTKVSLDGVDLKGVTRLVLEVDPNDYSRRTLLALEFIPGSIEVNAAGHVEIHGRDL